MKSASFIVTVTTDGSSRSKVWNTKKPMDLGRPLYWVLENTEDGIRVRDLSGRTSRSKSVEVPKAGKSALVNLTPDLQLRLHLVQHLDPTMGNGSITFADSNKCTAQERAERDQFRKALAGTTVGMILLLLLSLALSYLKPKEEELLPEQFTKIVMTAQPKPKTAAPGASTPTAGGGAAAAKKPSVVQAFKGASLQAAASKLLQGGMTRLLAQSDFVMGSAASEKARQSFGAKTMALAATAPAVGLTDGRKVDVASIGGAATAKGGVGYGKGEKAGVQGQGQAFVKMDVGGATVDEGLTRDEVGAVIHKHMSEIRYCYESSIVRVPNIEGKLVVAFVIGGNGAVKTAEVKDSTLPDPKLDDCIIRRLRSWAFPLPRGGVDVAVSYPFIFKSLGG
jgi:TonB family protein